MKLTLQRDKSVGNATTGKLYIDGILECYTLEDVVRDVKIQNQTAIPFGTYNVIIDMSNRFQRLLPLIENVSNFTGIRMHPGNTSVDTDGCILLGSSVQITNGNPFLASSKIAFDKFFPKLQTAFNAGQKITLEIK